MYTGAFYLIMSAFLWVINRADTGCGADIDLTEKKKD